MKTFYGRLGVIGYLVFLGIWPNCGYSTTSTPTVVVSITPFYTLVAAVMKGVGTPELLVKAGASPHHYALKPSDIQRLKKADLIFWAGPQLESFLIKALESCDLKKGCILVELDKTPQLLLLPVRQSPAWEAHTHSEHHCHLEHTSTDNPLDDMHFWLDPLNGILLVNHIVDKLSISDPIHAVTYQQNGADLKRRLKTLTSNISAALKPVNHIPYIVFHDAYQYFEHRFELKGVGAITLHPEVPPSAKRLKIIRNIIQTTKAQCVFSEPQFQPKLIENIIQDLKIRRGELDPLGQTPEMHPNGYIELLENLTRAIKQCLEHG